VNFLIFLTFFTFSELANLVTLAIDQLNETGIVVTNVTADNAQSNITMFHLLGANLNDPENLKVTLNLLNVQGKPIVVIQDVSHIVFLIEYLTYLIQLSHFA